VTVFDKLQFNFTVLPTANLICHDHVTCFYIISFSNCLNKIYSVFKVKDGYFPGQVTVVDKLQLNFTLLHCK